MRDMPRAPEFDSTLSLKRDPYHYISRTADRVGSDAFARINASAGAPVRLTNFQDGVRYMRVIDAAHTSWQTGRPVTIG